MPVLAAILMMVAWNMGDWREVADVFRMSRTDVAAWAVTLVLTVFADLTQAVEVGMALAALLFIRRVATTTDVAEVTDEVDARARLDVSQRAGHSALRRGLPGDGTVAVRRHRQARCHPRSARRAAAGRHAAA